MPFFDDLMGISGTDPNADIRKAATKGGQSRLDLVRKQHEMGQITTKEAQVLAPMAEAAGPEAALEEMAKRRQSQDNITFAKAYSKVLSENPDLYAQYLRAKGA